MPRINLLPVKAAQKVEQQRRELILLLALLGAVVVLGVMGAQIQRYQLHQKKSFLQTQLARAQQLAQDVRRVENFRDHAKQLEQRLDVIARLQKQKQGPTRMLDVLATLLTSRERVWLTSIRQQGTLVILEGEAMTHGDLSDFQQALEHGSKIFSAVTLEFAKSLITSTTTTLQWKMACTVDLNAS